MRSRSSGECGGSTVHGPGDGIAAPATCGDDAVLWLVLNLERSPDRLDAMTQSLGALGIAFDRVAGVDGRTLTMPVDGVDPDGWRRLHGRDLALGEVGCYLSHLRALSAFLSTRSRHAMILEDDARVTPEAIGLVERLTRRGAPDDWDLVKFEAHHGRVGLPIRSLTPRARLCALPFRSAGSAAYLVNRTAAKALLAGLLPMRGPYDLAFDRGWELKLRVRAVLPLPIEAPRDASTIDRGAGGKRRRASAWFRAYTKTLRLVSGLHAFALPSRTFP